jgi:hypothetical protein
MAGMLQIITYLLCFYLVVKGVEVLQIGLSSAREDKTAVTWIGIGTLAACIIAAVVFTNLQDSQASSLSTMSTPSIPSLPY